MQNPVTATERREAFTAHLKAQAAMDLDRSTEISRELVTHMASGGEYSMDDFIFALSMGRVGYYKKHQELLTQAAELCGRRIVGVVAAEEQADDRLWAVGIAAPEPLQLEVVNDPSSQQGPVQNHRRLRASLAMTHAAHFERYFISGAQIGPANVDLILQEGEPSLRRAELVHPNRRLLIGPQAVLGYLGQTSDQNAQLHVAEFMTHLAEAVHSPVSEAV